MNREDIIRQAILNEWCAAITKWLATAALVFFAMPVSAADHAELVAQIIGQINPPHTAEGAFEVTKRVAWTLRAEGAGLLLKPSGDNIVTWKGRSFSASRVCYPGGVLIKVLSDVPTTNGPSWQDNGTIDPALCVAAMDPEGGDVPVPTPPPSPPSAPPVVIDLSGVQAQLAAIAAKLDQDLAVDTEAARAAGDAHAAIHQAVTDLTSYDHSIGDRVKPILEFVAKYIVPALTVYLTCAKTSACK